MQEDDGEDEGGTPLAEMASGVWAPIGRPSADMAVRLQRRSSEGPGTALPTRSPVRGASTVNDLDAAWARVQARRITCCLQRLLQLLPGGGTR